MSAKNGEKLRECAPVGEAQDMSRVSDIASVETKIRNYHKQWKESC